MKEYKIFTFEEIAERVGLTQEENSRVKERVAEGLSLTDAIRPECRWPEGFLEKLKGKSLEEQMKYYRIVETVHTGRTAYGEITKENYNNYGYALEDYNELTALIVDDGVLIGVMIKSAWRREGYGTVALPYDDICTYYASDNNGSGYSEREDYAHLCCVTAE
ncbi:MAG: hypothetical protein E7218_04405 [Anaerofustis stercorihominis]|nr:hypothetical protein [Anaerofustis stercorihominis]